jgi:hypothetical protein
MDEKSYSAGNTHRAFVCTVCIPSVCDGGKLIASPPRSRHYKAAEDGSWNTPSYGQFDNAEEEDIDVEMLDPAEDAETAFPIVGSRHTSSTRTSTTSKDS